jgi:hypothetical protein
MENNKKIIYFIKNIVKEFLKEQVNNKPASKYFSNIGLNTEDVFDLIEYHETYRDLYPNYSDNENKYEEEFYFPTKEEAYSNVNEILEFFNNLPNPIPIYRSIKVKSMNNINYEWLGESWTFDKKSAINFAYNHAGGNVLLSGKTKFENVDWDNTVKLWYQFSGAFDNYDENEIRIINSDEIFDIKATKIKI